MAKKIMVVDDEESLIELVRAILEHEKYEVITSISGEECLKKLKTVKPDLILLDMMMPGMSGREVCESIRQNPATKDLKVAFLTVAKFSEAGKGVLEKMNVLDYITKPFENQDLVKRVKKIVG
ncbi:MAG: response regulator [Candidatus Aenigmarchaeota archaeon]|nr:response regulator [Candidatus Aenigmarchaeota archaeon]